MLYLVGLGLSDERDITVKGLEVIKKCDHVVLENYTSILHCGVERLQQYYGKTVEVADRECVESFADKILSRAKDQDVAFLVVGDPFGATTHCDLLMRAHVMGIKVKSVHNASIMNAIGACGLQLYNFGQTVSICFWTDSWRPDSFYCKIAENRRMGLHTLCLLDIKVKEASEENIIKGRSHIYEPPRFMTVNQALSQLLQIEEYKKEGVCCLDTLVVGLARVGADDEAIVAGTAAELSSHDFGAPLHSLIIPAPHLHDIEKQVLSLRFSLSDSMAFK
jgi:diphthine synthase